MAQVVVVDVVLVAISRACVRDLRHLCAVADLIERHIAGRSFSLQSELQQSLLACP